MSPYLRVAFLPDTFHEVNGVALTSRHLEAFARRKQIPFLSVHCGDSISLEHDGPVRIMQLKRGRLSFDLDANLDYDPLLMRCYARVKRQIQDFGADVIHITGPGDMGMLGWRLANQLKIPMAMSWHTSLHEYAGLRLERLLSLTPESWRSSSARLAEDWSLKFLTHFYGQARVILAPNNELVAQLHELTNRPTFLMQRGVDTHLFSPAHRTRTSPVFRIGFVGRLTPEKNVRFLKELGKALIQAGRNDFEVFIIGEGSEQDWLKANVPNVHLTGVLRGDALSRAYADMDLFVFPSTTDTFGNVILEALASGVPAVVTSRGGPKFLVQSGVTGYVAADFPSFIRCVKGILFDLNLHQTMCENARHYACSLTWDCVFERVFNAYRHCYNSASTSGAEPGKVSNATRLTA